MITSYLHLPALWLARVVTTCIVCCSMEDMANIVCDISLNVPDSSDAFVGGV